MRRLKRELEDAHEDLRREQEKSVVVLRSMKALRGPLEPVYRGLRMIFGEFDAAGVSTGEGPSVVASSNPKWDSWKQKMPGKPAEFIDLMLLHGEMTAAQLKAAAHCSSDTVYQTIYKLNAAQLISKNGGRFSLKT